LQSGIFSATIASWPERLDCVFRRITLRPCNTGRKIAGFWPDCSIVRCFRLFNRHFELLARIFFYPDGRAPLDDQGGYNYYFYGSCNGLNQSGFCASIRKAKIIKTEITAPTCGAVEKKKKCHAEKCRFIQLPDQEYWFERYGG
jgi:hypothetical protein